MATCNDLENWEDFEVPKLVIPVELHVHTVKTALYQLAKEKPVPKILTEAEIRENEQHKRELEIAFTNARQAFIDYQIKTVYTRYHCMNAIGKKKTMAKIISEIKDCKNYDAILRRLQIQKDVDKGIPLAVSN